MSSRNQSNNVAISKTQNQTSAKLAPKTGSDVLEVWADHGVWDTTTSAAINVEKTNFNEPK